MAGLDLGRFKSKKNDEWLDWLADDPVPAGLRARMRRKAVEQASRPVVRRVGEQLPPGKANAKQANPKADSAVSIHISIPKFSLPKFKVTPKALNFIRDNPRKKLIVAGSLGVIVVGVGLTTLLLTSGNEKKGNDTKGVLSDKTEKPTFAYSLPKGSQSEIEGDVRYDSQRKVANYKDSIGGIEITISQQPLPDSFKEGTEDKVKKLAEGFSATEVISTANPTAYLGNDVKGPQTVIFSKKNLLVFIQSAGKIDNHDWAEYITNLQ
jgi:hypothetical protein